jgi:hypothetical protein
VSAPDAMTTSQDEDGPQLYLFAFRIDPDSATPELLTLFVYGDTERPLTADERILFFSKPELGRQAIEHAGLIAQFPDPPPQEVSLTCDLAAALYLVAHADEDEGSVLLNCANTLLDMIAASQFAVPDAHSRVLRALADHLTFDRSIADFFNEHDVRRVAVQDALLWSAGAITARAHVIG